MEKKNKWEKQKVDGRQVVAYHSWQRIWLLRWIHICRWAAPASPCAPSAPAPDAAAKSSVCSSGQFPGCSFPTGSSSKRPDLVAETRGKPLGTEETFLRVPSPGYCSSPGLVCVLPPLLTGWASGFCCPLVAQPSLLWIAEQKKKSFSIVWLTVNYINITPEHSH